MKKIAICHSKKQKKYEVSNFIFFFVLFCNEERKKKSIENKNKIKIIYNKLIQKKNQKRKRKLTENEDLHYLISLFFVFSMFISNHKNNKNQNKTKNQNKNENKKFKIY